MTWLTDFWELWLIVGVAGALEWIAIAQGRRQHRPTILVRTISSRVWLAIARFPHFTPLFFSFWAIVLPHFYWPPVGRAWTTPEGWAILGVAVVTIWLIYVRRLAMSQQLTVGQKLKEEPLWTKFAAGTGLVGLVVLLLNKFAGVEVDAETVSAVFVFVGALVTAWQRRTTTSMAKIERLEDRGLIQTPAQVPQTVSEVIANPPPAPAPFPKAD